LIKPVEQKLRRKIRSHLRALGFLVDRNWSLRAQGESKEAVRALHVRQRSDRLEQARKFLEGHLECVLSSFASGSEVKPEKIQAKLELVESGTPACDLFRMASLTWSVPVSQGYGRRMRFLVWDESIHKLIGIIALGDPVFNLGVRDQFIGWNVEERSTRLVNIMDAYVLGAVPPYSFILGGKLIASLMRTTDIRDSFIARYGKSRGVISKKRKHPSLVMITTTSALGRSSVYNRVSLAGIQYLQSLGFTGGFGHFHVDGDLFADVREYLELREHPYARDYRFGKGPNWKFRAIRAAFELLGVDRGVLQHGLKRQVFACQLAKNAGEVLRDANVVPDYSDLLPVSSVAELAIERWLSPRALRRPEFTAWNREGIRGLLRLPERR
jgi:Druantia protein DruA